MRGKQKSMSFNVEIYIAYKNMLFQVRQMFFFPNIKSKCPRVFQLFKIKKIKDFSSYFN